MTDAERAVWAATFGASWVALVHHEQAGTTADYDRALLCTIAADRAVEALREVAKLSSGLLAAALAATRNRLRG